mgnify:CR=1 FL=1
MKNKELWNDLKGKKIFYQTFLEVSGKEWIKNNNNNDDDEFLFFLFVTIY